MLFFRSEEHVRRWCETRQLQQGAVMTLQQCWELARAWYANRLSRDWRRFTPTEVESLFRRLGFQGDFWRLG